MQVSQLYTFLYSLCSPLLFRGVTRMTLIKAIGLRMSIFGPEKSNLSATPPITLGYAGGTID